MESTLRNNVGMGGKPPSHPMRAMVKFTRQNPPPGFYTYAYLREDGRPYYIGKGVEKRAWRQHGSPGNYWKPPADERILFLKWGLTQEEAFAHEIYLIAIYGNFWAGGLLNKNFDEGGLGATGSRHTEEHKEHMRQVMTGRTLNLSKEGRKRLADARRNAPEKLRKEMAARAAATRKANGYKATEETRKKMSESMKGKNKYERTSEMRAVISAALTGHKQSEETIQKRRISQALNPCEKYGICPVIWAVMSKSARNVVAQRWLRGTRAVDELLCPKRQEFTKEAINARALTRKKKTAEKYGLTLDEWLSLTDRQTRKINQWLSRGVGRTPKDYVAHCLSKQAAAA